MSVRISSAILNFNYSSPVSTPFRGCGLLMTLTIHVHVHVHAESAYFIGQGEINSRWWGDTEWCLENEFLQVIRFCDAVISWLCSHCLVGPAPQRKEGLV